MNESVKLSCVVITYNMRREAYRTIYSLTRGQVGVDASDYEIIVVDNGSPQPVDAALFEGSATTCALWRCRLRTCRRQPR